MCYLVELFYVKGIIMDRTSIFNVAALRQEMILLTINEIIESLEKKGYKAENQLGRGKR